jgi:tungstate transport system substrate-binding protein
VVSFCHAARTLLVAITLLIFATDAGAADRFILVASTTSTQNSGLFDHLLPKFTDETGIEVRVIAVGTGQALKLGQRGDADLLLVHDAVSEFVFVREGYGVDRRDVMYNDFVVVGPSNDPAGASDAKDVSAAFRKIAKSGATFVSRGDDSGTHKAEQRIWVDVGIGPNGDWYRAAGAGMGATLNIASVMGAYTLADRATWLSFGNKGGLRIVHEGDKQLLNPYGVILVNPERFPHVKESDARMFMDWLVSDEGQEAISGFRIDDRQVFFSKTK